MRLSSSRLLLSVQLSRGLQPARSTGVSYSSPVPEHSSREYISLVSVYWSLISLIPYKCELAVYRYLDDLISLLVTYILKGIPITSIDPTQELTGSEVVSC